MKIKGQEKALSKINTPNITASLIIMYVVIRSERRNWEGLKTTLQKWSW